MPGLHAKLSPSASERWISCPASIRMEENVPKEPDSVYAAEGTAAHGLGELKASLAFGKITPRQFTIRRNKWKREFEHLLTDEVEAEMEFHTDAYVELILERVKLYPNSEVLFEQRMDTGVPTCWGTSDTVIVSPQHVEIIDFKYGMGVAVEAVGNPQLRLYGCGALDTYGDVLGDTEVIRITVHQPRLEHTLTEELTPDELRAWRTSIIPIAEVALGDDAPFGPSDEACRWCPASGRCPAQLAEVFSIPFEEPAETLSESDMAVYLGKVKLVKDWLNAFEQAALNMAYSEQKEIPGFKVVMSGGKRYFRDGDGAIEELVKAGYSLDKVSKRSIRGIGELETLLKEKFTDLVDPFLSKSEGKPSLVPESDRRRSINPGTRAAEEFDAISE